MPIEQEDEDESSWEKALRNELILENIFKYLPTGFLLSSCGFVNKCWNNESRIVIRKNNNNRKCTVKITGSCQFLKNLDECCREITDHGRLVPFNALILSFDGRQRASDSRCDKELTIPNLTRQMKLFHLDFDCRFSCNYLSVHKPLYKLLQHKCNQLQSLKIQWASLLGAALGTDDWNPDFPRLQFISILNATAGQQDSAPEQSLEIIRKIMEGAPNLSRIIVGDLETLRMVPEDKYKYLQEIKFKFTQPRDDATLYENIIEAKSRLKTLNIDGQNNNFHDRQEMRFGTTLEKLLQAFHQSLKTISVAGAYAELGWLSYPPLINLSKLRMDSRNEVGVGGMAEFYSTFSAIDYANTMPGLEEVEFEAPVLPDELRDAWNLEAVDQSSCTTARKLTLNIASAGADLSFFKPIFPNVSSLKIIFYPMDNVMPFSKIWELWPSLEELEISGEGLMLMKIYDSEFCGISPEEVHLLRWETA